MDAERLFSLAKPYLEKNDLGSAHTARVLAIARKIFVIPKDADDLTVAAIILHDIGGSSIREQYERGPAIASSLLRQINVDEPFLKKVCQIVGTHHEHPDHPSEPFRILYDSDKIVMFSPEEYPIYNARPDYDWNRIIDSIYSEEGKNLAKEILRLRRKASRRH